MQNDSNLYDLNGDTVTDTANLAILARHVANVEVITDADKLKLADVDNSGVVNAADLAALARVILGSNT